MAWDYLHETGQTPHKEEHGQDTPATDYNVRVDSSHYIHALFPSLPPRTVSPPPRSVSYHPHVAFPECRHLRLLHPPLPWFPQSPPLELCSLSSISYITCAPRVFHSLFHLPSPLNILELYPQLNYLSYSSKFSLCLPARESKTPRRSSKLSLVTRVKRKKSEFL